MKWKIGLSFQTTDAFGRIETHVGVSEDDGMMFSQYLFSATFVNMELESARKIMNEIIIPALNESELKIEDVCG